VNAKQEDWADYVGQGKLSYTVTMHLAIKMFSFMVAYGVDDLQPTNPGIKGAHSTSKFNQNGEDLAKNPDLLLVRKHENATNSKSMPKHAK
jgi:hypothetical protein